MRTVVRYICILLFAGLAFASTPSRSRAEGCRSTDRPTLGLPILTADDWFGESTFGLTLVPESSDSIVRRDCSSQTPLSRGTTTISAPSAVASAIVEDSNPGHSRQVLHPQDRLDASIEGQLPPERPPRLHV